MTVGAKGPTRLAAGKLKSPDFVWEGKSSVVVFEMKNVLKPRSDQGIFFSRSLVEAWRRASEAIEQGTAQYERNREAWKSKKCVLVLVTAESFTEETVFFLSAAKRWLWLKGSGFVALLHLSSAEFEYYANFADADTLATAAEKIWESLEPNGTQQILRPDDLAASLGRAARLPHLEDAWKRLFPNSKSWSDGIEGV